MNGEEKDVGKKVTVLHIDRLRSFDIYLENNLGFQVAKIKNCGRSRIFYNLSTS
jgi:hypothetical protein